MQPLMKNALAVIAAIGLIHAIPLIDCMGLMQPLMIAIAVIAAIGLMMHPIGLMQPLMQTVRPIACATNSDAMHAIRPILHLSTAGRPYRTTKTNWGNCMQLCGTRSSKRR